MKVELSNDAVDEIFRSILIQDYEALKSDIRRLESIDELAKYQKEDLKNNKKYVKAMKKLMSYYIGYNWKSYIAERNKEFTMDTQ